MKKRGHQISLGDLLRALDQLKGADESIRPLMLDLFGFKLAGKQPEPTSLPAPKPATQPEAHSEPPSEAEDTRVDVEKPDVVTQGANDAWLELLSLQELKVPDWFASVQAMSESEEAASLESPPIDSLLNPRWTRSILHQALSIADQDSAIDIERTVEQLARAEPLLNFPRARRMKLRGGVQVLLDLNESMRPYTEDQQNMLQDIKRITMAQMVSQWYFKRYPSQGVSRDVFSERMTYSTPPPGTSVLLLTDLGVGRRNHNLRERVKEWRWFSEQVYKAGSSLVAFVPFQTERVEPSLRRLMAVVPWDRATTTAMVKRLRQSVDRRASR